MNPHFHSLDMSVQVVKWSTVKGTYIAARFKGERLFRIRPDKAIAGKVGSKLIQWLPSEQYSAVGRAVEKSPMHWV